MTWVRNFEGRAGNVGLPTQLGVYLKEYISRCGKRLNAPLCDGVGLLMCQDCCDVLNAEKAELEKWAREQKEKS